MASPPSDTPSRPIKSVDYSKVTLGHVIEPQDANPAGIAHGGVIMKLIDNAGGVAAIRHTRCNVVTASIDRMDFHHPAFIGNLVVLNASLNMVGTTSMEVGVRVETEDLRTGEIRHTASAYLTYVALDENHRPTPVPDLLLKTDEERRRNREARERRQVRLAEKKKEKACRSASEQKTGFS
ncbi:acyl-CoA thioesterase [Desulfosarcina sp. OttesenSCG-928-G10]|nr:acyl-CoA thioesterase [Desulfosarcina sp. OttesenSCG-928-G10]MDL2321834.1 acyl-CoA thioesterase [Desulfosarcina sp. OttesenSCG-928-B08]